MRLKEPLYIKLPDETVVRIEDPKSLIIKTYYTVTKSALVPSSAGNYKKYTPCVYVIDFTYNGNPTTFFCKIVHIVKEGGLYIIEPEYLEHRYTSITWVPT